MGNAPARAGRRAVFKRRSEGAGVCHRRAFEAFMRVPRRNGAPPDMRAAGVSDTDTRSGQKARRVAGLVRLRPAIAWNRIRRVRRTPRGDFVPGAATYGAGCGQTLRPVCPLRGASECFRAHALAGAKSPGFTATLQPSSRPDSRSELAPEAACGCRPGTATKTVARRLPSLVPARRDARL